MPTKSLAVDLIDLSAVGQVVGLMHLSTMGLTVDIVNLPTVDQVVDLVVLLAVVREKCWKIYKKTRDCQGHLKSHEGSSSW